MVKVIVQTRQNFQVDIAGEMASFKQLKHEHGRVHLESGSRWEDAEISIEVPTYVPGNNGSTTNTVYDACKLYHVMLGIYHI